MLGKRARQHDMAVDDRASGIDDGIVGVVPVGEDRIERGDRAARDRVGASPLDDARNEAQRGGRIAFHRRRLAERQADLPLRVRDEGLTLELEEDFATFRNQIEAGSGLDTVEATAAELSRGLDSVERVLSEPGIAAPTLAALYSFLILFREGFEAVLVVAAILGYLEASRNTQYRPAVLRGVGIAGIATVVTFVIAALIIDVAPVQREVIEAVTALLAVVVLFYV
jgi:hypothetical protein